MSNNGEAKQIQLTANEKRELQDIALRAFSSLYSDRADLARSLGMQFDGTRDIYTELGYKKSLSFEDYDDRQERDGLAGRVVDKPVDDSWRSAPAITDGGKHDTDFTKALAALAKKLKLWRELSEVDRVSGIGRYGVLLIGVKDGKKLKEPIDGDVGDVLYLRPYTESEAKLHTFDRNPQSARFGQPETYQLDLGDLDDAQGGGTGLGVSSLIVHHSRVIHIAEKSRLGVYGRPRLKRSFNRFMDLEKLVGGSAEAAWKLIYKGLMVTEQENADISDSKTEIEDKFLDYIHKLKRVLVASGVDVTELGNTEMPDPSGQFGVQISLIAADIDMPQRILIGSERGDLASSTDQALWAGTIENRREQHVDPDIVRPVIDWMIAHGVLPVPSSGSYELAWESIFELSDVDIADVNDKRSNAIDKLVRSGAVESGIVTTQEVRELGRLAPTPQGETVDEMLDIEDAMPDEMAEEMA